MDSEVNIKQREKLLTMDDEHHLMAKTHNIFSNVS
jgi:hypothetical protein